MPKFNVGDRIRFTYEYWVDYEPSWYVEYVAENEVVEIIEIGEGQVKIKRESGPEFWIDDDLLQIEKVDTNSSTLPTEEQSLCMNSEAEITLTVDLDPTEDESEVRND